MKRRLIKNLLHLNNLRKIAGFSLMKEAMASGTAFEILKTPPKGRALVLSPHPDDDVFACGGTIALHRKQGDKVKVLYITGNTDKISNSCLPAGKAKFQISNSDKNLKANEASEANKASSLIKNLRFVEAEKASKILGVSDIEFLGEREGRFVVGEKIVEKIAGIIDEFKPEIIYLPSFLDPHPDHIETSLIFAKYLEKNKFAGQIFSYEVWSPIYVNRLIVIDKVIEQKKEAMNEHKSQLQNRSYIDAMLGLNRYRAGMFSAGKYAEGFLATNAKLFLEIQKISF